MKDIDIMLIKAEQQLTGFNACHVGGPSPIIELIESMGLTKNEWGKLKKEYGIEVWLQQDLFEEIEKHYKYNKEVL
jgi:hypothetical protein